MDASPICKAYKISSLSLSGTGLCRDYPRKLNKGEQLAYSDTYDFDTLFYDSFFDPVSGKLTAMCPKLFNLQRLVNMLSTRVSAPFDFTRYARYDILSANTPEAPTSLTVEIGGRVIGSDISPVDHEFFAGCNVLLTMSKDNRPRWIRDWARHHVEAHGANGVLFVDNGSTGYGLNDIIDVLRSVDGLRRVAVISAPFRYGPVRSEAGRGSSKARFLQPAFLNLARLRFLQKARAVLLTDVDELVFGAGGVSIFDAVVRSPIRYISIPGRWYDTSPEVAGQACHADHKFLRSDVGRCPPKYCVVPDSLLGAMSWSVHKLEAEWTKVVPKSSSFYYAHLMRITDNWKGRLHMK